MHKKIFLWNTVLLSIHVRNIVKKGLLLKVSNPEERISNRVISDISVVLRETTLTISDSIETVPPVESEIVRVVYLSTTKISEMTRLKKKKKGNDLRGPDTLREIFSIRLLHCYPTFSIQNAKQNC